MQVRPLQKKKGRRARRVSLARFFGARPGDGSDKDSPPHAKIDGFPGKSGSFVLPTSVMIRVLPPQTGETSRAKGHNCAPRG